LIIKLYRNKNFYRGHLSSPYDLIRFINQELGVSITNITSLSEWKQFCEQNLDFVKILIISNNKYFPLNQLEIEALKYRKSIQIAYSTFEAKDILQEYSIGSPSVIVQKENQFSPSIYRIAKSQENLSNIF